MAVKSVCPYNARMNADNTNFNCSLDAETAVVLKVLAQRWRTTPADALRRAILMAVCEPVPPRADALSRAERRRAWRDLYAALGADSDAWVRKAQAIRWGSSAGGQ